MNCILLGYSKDEKVVPWLKAALEICDRIYRDHGVYLLHAIFVERELLKIQLKNPGNAADVERIISRFESTLPAADIINRLFDVESRC